MRFRCFSHGCGNTTTPAESTTASVATSASVSASARGREALCETLELERRAGSGGDAAALLLRSVVSCAACNGASSRKTGAAFHISRVLAFAADATATYRPRRPRHANFHDAESSSTSSSLPSASSSSSSPPDFVDSFNTAAAFFFFFFFVFFLLPFEFDFDFSRSRTIEYVVVQRVNVAIAPFRAPTPDSKRSVSTIGSRRSPSSSLSSPGSIMLLLAPPSRTCIPNASAPFSAEASPTTALFHIPLLARTSTKSPGTRPRRHLFSAELIAARRSSSERALSFVGAVGFQPTAKQPYGDIELRGRDHTASPFLNVKSPLTEAPLVIVLVSIARGVNAAERASMSRSCSLAIAHR